MAGALGEEVPEDGAGQEVDGVVGDVGAEAEELGENEIEDGEHEEWTEDGPEVAED